MNPVEGYPDNQPERLYDEELQLYDPTGEFYEWPDDRSLLSWLKTAYLVKKALEVNPDNPYLTEATNIVSDAILNRKSELKITPPPDR